MTLTQSPVQRLRALLAGEPYLNYVYSYPHKTAYRPLPLPLDLGAAWAGEDKRALFLYVHIPFCEMRCGYCNLFTTPNPETSLVSAYLAALERQMAAAADWLGDFRFEQLALGGGTPSYLGAGQLDRLFRALDEHLGARRLPASVEVSPATVDADKLACLHSHGVERISIGIESFQPHDLQALGRPQSIDRAERALAAIRAAGIPRLNIDLIYGNPGQTPAGWLASLERTLVWQPEEIFLYPLYVRPLTGLGRQSGPAPHDARPQLYELGRDRLLEAGYRQTSMRMFTRRPPANSHRYRCQEDGMVGLGAGARSYTREWHYSTRYAVGRQRVRDILQAYAVRPAAAFREANHGIRLDAGEQRHRYLLLGLLQVEGLDRAAYRLRFGSDALDDFPHLAALPEQGLARWDSTHLRLTAEGIAKSDLIGHWLFSEPVRQRMAEWDWH